MEQLFHKENLIARINQIPRYHLWGKVTRVVGLIIEAHLPRVPVGGLCAITSEIGVVYAEIIGLKGSTAVLMPIGETHGIEIGDEVELVQREVKVKVGPSLLGRILDGRGNPMDNGGPLGSLVEYPLYQPAISAVKRQLISKPLSLGVRAIDGLLTVAVGQRMSIMAGSGVGKSTLLGMMARNANADVNVIGLIGERGREVREFIENDLGPEGLKKSVLVIATSDTPALTRMGAAFVATAISEYFRDRGNKVLLMMDSLTRFAMASREIGLSLGEPPTTKGYTPSLFSVLPRLLERAGTTDHAGSITGLYTILAEGDDVQDPIADAVRAIVDGHIVLSRKLASLGHYPPIDILQSLSRVMRAVITKDHRETSTKIRRHLSVYQEMEDYIKIGIYSPGKNPELDVAVNQMPEIKKFLCQDVGEKTSFEESCAWLTKISMGGA